MGNKQPRTYIRNQGYIETTINKIIVYDDSMDLVCSPCPLFGPLSISKNNPQAPKIKTNSTYKFSYIWDPTQGITIVDVTVPLCHTICQKVTGVVNVLDNNKLTPYYELEFDNFHDGRILISKTKGRNIIIGKVYMVNYVKDFGTDFFRVTGHLLSNNVSNINLTFV